MTVSRGFLFLAGTAICLYGAWLLIGLGGDGLDAAVVWLGVSVIAHDAVLAPLTIGLALVAARFLPSWLRSPVAAGLVVLGSVTLLAIPVLGRFGARDDNLTLLDRDYGQGWAIFAAATAIVVAVLSALSWRRQHSAPS
ncbi:MAG: hypothetical protein ACR2GB_05310 [Nocardioidaceae bacterium]